MKCALLDFGSSKSYCSICHHWPTLHSWERSSCLTLRVLRVSFTWLEVNTLLILFSTFSPHYPPKWEYMLNLKEKVFSPVHFFFCWFDINIYMLIMLIYIYFWLLSWVYVIYHSRCQYCISHHISKFKSRI